MRKFLFPIAALLLLWLALLAGCSRQAAPYPDRPERSAPVQARQTLQQPYVVATLPDQPPQPAWQPVVGRVVILDAGHGGDDHGASYFGVKEKDVNLALVLRTAARLRAAGITVHLTRQGDIFIPLPERSAIANRNPNAVFVSIHCNASAKNPMATGIETYILSQQFSDDEQCRKALARYNLSGKDKAGSRDALDKLTRVCRAQGPVLAGSLQRSLVGALGDPDRGVRHGNLAVLRETFFCPAVLVEVGFLSNYQTARKMANGTWRDLASQAIAEGIVTYLRQG